MASRERSSGSLGLIAAFRSPERDACRYAPMTSSAFPGNQRRASASAPQMRSSDGASSAALRYASLASRKTPLEVTDAAKVHVSVARGSERKGLLQGSGSLAMTAEAQVDPAEIAVRRGAVGGHGHDALEPRQGILEPAVPLLEHGEVLAGRPGNRPELRRMPERRFRVGLLPAAS